MVRCALGLVLLILLLAAPASAESKWHEALSDKIFDGKMKALRSLSDREILDTASKHADEWAILCEKLWWDTPKIARSFPHEVRAALEAVHYHAAKMNKAYPDVRYYDLAHGWASLALYEHMYFIEGETPPKDWPEAAEALERAKEITPKLAVYAATALLTAARHPKSDLDALVARSRAIMQAYMKPPAEGKKRDPVDDAVAWGDWYLHLARAQLAHKKKGPATKSVGAGAAVIRPYVEIEKPKPDVAEVHTNLAALSLHAKLKLKGLEWRVQEKFSLHGSLRLEIPAGRLWEWGESGEGTVATAYQFTGRGQYARMLTVQVYDANRPVEAPGGVVVSVPEPKGMAEAYLPGLAEYFSIVEVDKKASFKKPKKARGLHKDFSDGREIRVEGTREDGSFLRVRMIFFRNKKLKCTYSVRIREYEREPGESAMLAFVLAHIRLHDGATKR